LFADMDRALREIGVSDVVIGNRIKEMARGFYGRIAAYEAGLADPTTLSAALRRNVYGTVPEVDASAVAALADYVCRCDAAMAADPARRWDAVALETEA
jgi:cytochrome b pre-mRNA-processing protein 3